MTILDDIIAAKRKEVADRKSLYPVKLLEQSIFFSSPIVSLKKYLLRKDASGIIAEIKRKSPSKGMINAHLSIERTSIGYMQAGASALSVLTDNNFFGGSNEDLMIARKFNFCPILRKDFIIDEYQIIEAKSIGADVILLIAAVLTPAEIKQFTSFAHALGMEVLLEVHNAEEIQVNVDSGADAMGVNNRNLKTFHVSVDTSMHLANVIPDHYIKISESGIDNPQTILKLRDAGYQGFLMGQNFMQHSRPEEACKRFIATLTKLKSASNPIHHV